jgi:octaprenyl-diphosphate synthase
MAILAAADKRHVKLTLVPMNKLNLTDLFVPIASKLEAVEAELQAMLQSEIPVVRRLSEHVSKGSGKRLRPALVLLASKFCGCPPEDSEDVRFAAIFELIHTATLIHDDIIDHAATRRGRPTLNATWGNTLSVLFGDFLSLQAIRSGIRSRSWQLIEIIADVAASMIEGELIQNEYIYNLSVDRKTYFEIIERKTALLFAACAETGAVVAGRDASVCKNLKKFGFELGMAFQLVDDLLAYTSTSDRLGKPVFSDLQEGKLTLPVIALLEKAHKDAAPIIERVWACSAAAPSEMDTQELLGLMKQHGTMAETQKLAESASLAAIDALGSMPNFIGHEEIAKLLQDVPEIMVQRTY